MLETRILQCLIKNLFKFRKAPALVILLQIHPQFFERLLVATPTLDQIRYLMNRLPESIDLLPRNNFLSPERPIPGRISGHMQHPKGCSENRLRCKRATHAFSPNARPEWRGAEGAEMQTGRAIPRPLQAACYLRLVGSMDARPVNKVSYRDVHGDNRRH
jgi:hypothetical protein